MTGFRDWQRETAWDGPELFSDHDSARVGGFSEGPFNVSRYASLALTFQLTSGGGGGLVAICSWFDDVGNLVAVRNFPSRPEIAAPFALIIPNLGPRVTVSFVPASLVANYTAEIALRGTNRQPAMPAIPSVPALIAVNDAPLLAGGSHEIWPLTYFAGEADLWVTSGAKFSVQERIVTETGAVIAANEWNGNAANFDLRVRLSVPPGAWRFDVQSNDLGDSTYWLVLTPVVFA